VLIGVELVPEKAIFMAAGDQLRTWLTVDGALVEGSEGLDEYQDTACFLAGRRLAATGRSQHFRIDRFPAGLGPYETEPAQPVSCRLKGGSTIRFESEVSNSILLDPGLYLDYIGVRIIGTGTESQVFPLRRPDIKLDWPERGRMGIDLTPLVGLAGIASGRGNSSEDPGAPAE
jgi:hypothetical protein